MEANEGRTEPQTHKVNDPSWNILEPVSAWFRSCSDGADKRLVVEMAAAALRRMHFETRFHFL